MSNLTLWNKCQKAASLLDKKIPEWYKIIDINELEMFSCARCILGQVYGRYGNRDSNQILYEAMPLGISDAFASNLRPDVYTDSKLRSCWETLIDKRIAKEFKKMRKNNE